ncbi:MAG TPA: WxL domain-containing protein [Chloroflexota bacterium]|jgi:hypothetical protein|nr:WxL domain-containing protein [Chloroflexota bacterium]
MTFRLSRLHRLGLLPAALLAFAAPAAVHAAAGTAAATAVLQGGPLALQVSSITFPDITLNGQDQVACTAPSGAPANAQGCTLTGSQLSTATITDATGTGDGWHLTVGATQWTDVDNNPNHVIPIINGTVQVDGAQLADTVSGGVPPTSTLGSGPFNIPQSPSSTPIFNAQPGSGLGKVLLSIQWALLVPLNTYAGEYENTVTYTLTQGP